MNVSFSSKIFKRPIQTDTLLVGGFQAENAALAALAVKAVLPNISEDVIERGLAKAKLPARFEIIQNPKGFENIPFLVMDGAHTVNSVRFTMETMNQVFGKTDGRSEKVEGKKSLLFACAADKDAKDIAPLFKNQFDSVFLTKPGNVKQSDLETLATAFNEAEIPYDINEDFEAQIKKAFDHANAHKSILLVTGSFYLIAEVKKFLLNLM
jgi:dihydrofolate synthase/folylpolyglutamate synthase